MIAGTVLLEKPSRRGRKELSTHGLAILIRSCRIVYLRRICAWELASDSVEWNGLRSRENINKARVEAEKKKYKAACTPDFYLFDQSNLLIYRGRLDDSSPGSQNQATGNELRNVLDDFLAGNEISNEQNPSMGCSIKWK